MHDNVILVVNYDKICRFCLQSTGAMSDLFETNGETSLAKLALFATGLDVYQGDGLPPNMCHKCRYIVELSCEFREMCMKSLSLLQQATSDEHWTKNETKKRKRQPKVTPNPSKDLKNNGILTVAQKDDDISGHDEDANDDLEDSVSIKLEEPFDTGEYSNEADNRDVGLGGSEKEMKSFYHGYFATGRRNSEHPEIQSLIRKPAPKHLTCQICLDSFSTVGEVSTHVETHYIGTKLTNYLFLHKPYECEECNDGIIRHSELIRHHRRHLNVNPYKCKVCSYVGKNPDTIRLHAMTHGAYTQVCEECGSRFRQPKDLKVHLLRMHQRQPSTCQLCRRVYRNVFTYRAHMKMHKREPRFPCGWRGCPKAYHSRAEHEAHMRTHTGERKYKCHLCDAATYTSQSLLNRHLRLHQRKRISKCDKCLATFEDYGEFYRHRVSAHGPWQPYRCIGCNKGYQSAPQLQKHKQACEPAILMQSYSEDLKDEEMIVSCEQDIVETDQQELQMETDQTLTRRKRQSLRKV